MDNRGMNGKIKKAGKCSAWLLKHVKSYIPQLLALILLNSATVVVSLGTTYANKEVIDRATNGGSLKSALVLYAIIIVTQIIISIIYSIAGMLINERFSFGIRIKVYERILKTYSNQLDKYHSGDLITRLTSDIGNVCSGITDIIPELIALVVRLVSAFLMLAYYDMTLAIFAVVIAPVAAISCLFLGNRLKKIQTKVQESESAYRSYMQESVVNANVVKAFTYEETAMKNLTELRNERMFWIFKKAKMNVAVSETMHVFFYGGYMVAFALGAQKVATGMITYGVMTVFINLYSQIQSPFMQLSSYVPKVVSILSSSQRIMEIEELDIENHVEECMRPEKVSVIVKDLSFEYDESKKVLDNTSIKIYAGDFVAILGESGVGKTTLIKLIMSFLKPTAGSIEFEDENGNCEESTATSRNYISYVPQGNTLFSGTIRNNLLMGNENATEEDMIEALKTASAYSFVSKLPNGLDTVIGENATGLSMGQSQRISIARALVRKSPLLVLDEATSALDEKTEMQVLENIRNMDVKPTCILITHRRSVLAFCDREIKIENGKICQG